MQVPDAVYYRTARWLVALGGPSRRLGDFLLALADARKREAEVRRVDAPAAAKAQETVARALELLQEGERQAAHDALMDALRALQHAAPPPAGPQAWLWVRDAPDLPARPLRVSGALRFPCIALQCPMTARECVLRQKVSEIQRTNDTWRGQASDFPMCSTETCAQGRGIREALDPADEPTPRMHGPGGRFRRGKKDVELEEAAKARLRREGLLDEVPSIDAPPVEAEEEGEDHGTEDAAEAQAGGEAEAGAAPAGAAARPNLAARGRRAARR